MSHVATRAVAEGVVAEARSADRTEPAATPRTVIRGEETKAKIDWLNATFARPGGNSDSVTDDGWGVGMSPIGFVGLLGRVLGRPIFGVEGGGRFGFEHTVKMFVRVGAREFPFGELAFGGESQAGRWMLSLPGSACSLVEDWTDLSALLEDLDAKLTRVDLAVDFFEGEYSVDDAVCMHELGGFTFDGKTAPKVRPAGDWFDETEGRTLYVGKRENGKMLRVYEKGKQMGDQSSDWCRFEVQLGNRDRVIPFGILTEPDQFFAGAYPCLSTVLSHAKATAIKTSREKEATTLAHLAFHLKRSYGKVLGFVLDKLGDRSAVELIEELRVVGAPRRLDASSAQAGVLWSHVLDRMKRKQQ